MATATPLELEPASPDVKRYQRQKISVVILSTILSLGWMATLGIVFGRDLGREYTALVGDEAWLRLLLSGATLGITIEILTLPLGFYSGYVLEHRYHLSNQSSPAGCGNAAKAISSAACSAQCSSSACIGFSGSSANGGGSSPRSVGSASPSFWASSCPS